MYLHFKIRYYFGMLQCHISNYDLYQCITMLLFNVFLFSWSFREILTLCLPSGYKLPNFPKQYIP